MLCCVTHLLYLHQVLWLCLWRTPLPPFKLLYSTRILSWGTLKVHTHKTLQWVKRNVVLRQSSMYSKFFLRKPRSLLALPPPLTSVSSSILEALYRYTQNITENKKECRAASVIYVWKVLWLWITLSFPLVAKYDLRDFNKGTYVGIFA